MQMQAIFEVSCSLLVIYIDTNMLLSMSIFAASKSPRLRPPTPATPETTPKMLQSATTVDDEGKIWSTICRWPALTICLSVTSLLLFLLFCFDAAGWPGSEPTSNCYEDYLVTPDCFCEKLWGDKPGDVWIAQPMNTLTNLYFVIVGLMIAYAADSRQFPSKEWWENNKNPITQDNIYSIVLALDACLLGVGSTFLHASFTSWGRQADMGAMYLIGTFMIVYPLLRERYVTKEQAIWMYILTNLSLIYWVTNLSSPEHARKLFTTLMVASWLIEVFMVDPEWAKKNRFSRRIFVANIVMFVGAVLQWKASESGMPLCYPESIFQGHSLWHFQSAVGIGGTFVYYLAEEVPISMIHSSPSSSKNTTKKDTKKNNGKKQILVENPPSTAQRAESAAGVQSVTSHSSSSDHTTEVEHSGSWSDSGSESASSYNGDNDKQE
jgi:hypothetical protein